MLMWQTWKVTRRSTNRFVVLHSMQPLSSEWRATILDVCFVVVHAPRRLLLCDHWFAVVFILSNRKKWTSEHFNRNHWHHHICVALQRWETSKERTYYVVDTYSGIIMRLSQPFLEDNSDKSPAVSNLQRLLRNVRWYRKIYRNYQQLASGTSECRFRCGRPAFKHVLHTATP